MKRATIADLSREAGVSVATVDRVLNGRLTVREETARKVHEAARRIGYHGANAIHSRILADLPELHFGIVLQKGGHAFYQAFATEIEDQLRAHTAPSPARDAALPREHPPRRTRPAARIDGGQGAGGRGDRARPPRGHPRRGRPSRARHPDVFAAFRLCPGRSRKLRRAEQPEGRARGRMADGAHGPAAGQGRHLRRRAPLPRTRAAGDGPAQLLPRVRPRPRGAERRCSIWRIARSPTRPRTRSSRSIRDLAGIYCAGGGMEGAIGRCGSRGAPTR